MQTNLKAALAYAAQGYPVLLVWPLDGKVCTCRDASKCKTPGKHPIAKAWQKTATTDASRITRMFAKHPDAHVGIMPPEGCCFIDVDPRNGGSDTLKSLMNGHKLPVTPTQLSGGGGTHYVFRGEPIGPLGKGIDVKKAGRGFVVAWPSSHVIGGEGSYKWKIAPRMKPALLPVYMRRTEEPVVVLPPDIPHYPIAKIKEALAHVNADDYHRWVDIGQALKNAYGDDGEAVWLAWSKTSEKWNEKDEEKWQGFDRNRDRPLITIRSIMAIARRSGYRPLATEFEQGLWAIGDITGLARTTPEPIEWAFKGCIPCGKVTVLAGAGGSSKSFFALTLAMQIAVAQALGPFEPQATGRAMMIVAEEDKADIHRRVYAITKAREYTDEQVALIEKHIGIVSVRGMDWRLMRHDDAGDLQETDRVDYLIDEVRALGDVKLLVLDPLIFFSGIEENKNEDGSRLMFTLDRIAAATGAAVLVLHHVSKAGLQIIDDVTQSSVRGASALVDNARSVLMLVRMPVKEAALYGISDTDAARHIVAKHVKSNYGPHLPDAFFVIGSGGALRYAPEITKQDPRMLIEAEHIREGEATARLVLAYFNGRPDGTVRECAHKINRGKSTVQHAIDDLTEDDYLVREGVGRNTAYIVTDAGKKALKNTPKKGEENLEDLF